MDPTVLNPWIVLAVGFLGILGTIWNIVSKPGAKAQEGVATLSSKVESIEERLAVIETNIDHLPDRDSTHRLELAIAKLEGRFDALDERLKPVAAMATRFQDYMLRER